MRWPGKEVDQSIRRVETYSAAAGKKVISGDPAGAAFRFRVTNAERELLDFRAVMVGAAIFLPGALLLFLFCLLSLSGRSH